MDMSFQEKSAWGLLAGILIVSAYYFPVALKVVAQTNHAAALIGVSVGGVIAITVIETIYHIIIAATGSTQSDERDAMIDLKAERNGGLGLGLGLFVLIGYIVQQHIALAGQGPGALTIVIYILGALTLSEVAKLVSQIWYYRRGR